MSFKCILREFLTGKKRMDEKVKKQTKQKRVIGHKDRHVAPYESSSCYPCIQQSPWANMPPELLHDIIGRVDADETTWPARRAVVSCAAVCKSWREISKEALRTPEECGFLTFPLSLKQPGPKDSPIQCFIRRERATSTYRLYLGLSPALSGNASKFLLGARRIRKATKTDFLISLSANEFSQSSDSYAGKLRFLQISYSRLADKYFGFLKSTAYNNRSNFFGSKFFIHDCQTPSNSEIPSHGRSWKRISTKKILPRLPLCSYKVATISYELNVLRTRGPRRMYCAIHSIPVPQISTSTRFSKSKESIGEDREQLVLRNKTPRWHEQLQCWCLNFRGRVTVASVKNFQLVAAAESSQDIPYSEQETVILQFGKMGKDIFTMDYRYPLSAFQAFAICLSSFDTKPACE